MKRNPFPIAASVSISLFAVGATAAEGGKSTSLVERPRPAESKSEMGPHVGIYAGGATQNGDGYRTDPAFMVDAGFQPIIPFSFAIQVQHEPSSLDVPGAHVDFNTTNFLLKETLNFGGDIPVLRNAFAGAKTGVAMYSGDIDTKTHFAVGGTLGFDIPLEPARAVSLGAEATYLGVLGSDEATPDQTSVLGAVKYWF